MTRHVKRPRSMHKTKIVTSLVSRTVAKAEGLKHYFTGTSCVRGHIVRRLVSNRGCTACRRENDRARYSFNRPKERQRSLDYQRRHITPTRPCPPTCEMCDRPPKTRALHLDHDHKTGKFRGWLCQSCNTTLGRFGDNETGLLNALDYLRRANVA